MIPITVPYCKHLAFASSVNFIELDHDGVDLSTKMSKIFSDSNLPEVVGHWLQCPTTSGQCPTTSGSFARFLSLENVPRKIY